MKLPPFRIDLFLIALAIIGWLANAQVFIWIAIVLYILINVFMTLFISPILRAASEQIARNVKFNNVDIEQTVRDVVKEVLSKRKVRR
jgi:hypothetical protein